MCLLVVSLCFLVTSVSAHVLCHGRRSPEADGIKGGPSFLEPGHCSLPKRPGTDTSACSWRAASYGAAQWEVAATLRGHTDAVCSVAFANDGEGVVTGSADGTSMIWRHVGDEDAATSRVPWESPESRGDPERWKVEATLGARHKDPLVRDVTFAPDSAQVLLVDDAGRGLVWERQNESSADHQVDSGMGRRQGEIEFIGCFDEFQFKAKKYYGNEAAVSFEFMAEQARRDGRRYFAMARHEAEFGHAYTLDGVAGTPRYGRAACGSKCTDNATLWCGCANEDSWRYPHTSTRNPDCPTGMRILATYDIWTLPPWKRNGTDEPYMQSGEAGPDARPQDIARRLAPGSNPPDDFNESNESEDWIRNHAHQFRKVPHVPQELMWKQISVLQGHGDTAWAAHWPAVGSAKLLAGARDVTACVKHPRRSRSGKMQAERSSEVSIIGCPQEEQRQDSHRAHGTTARTATYAQLGGIWEHERTVPPATWSLAAYLEARPKLVTAVQWSFDGRRILIGASDGFAHIFQIGGPDVHLRGRPRWDVVTSCKAHVQAVWAVAWSPDSRRVLTGSKDGTLRIWQPLAKGPEQWDEAVSLDNLSSDDPADVAGPFNGTGVDRSMSRGYPWKLLAELNQRSNMDWVSTWSVAVVATWSPDGLSILTGSDDGTVRIWQESIADTTMWQVVATLKGHTGKAWAVAWFPDSSRVLTGGEDGVVRIWRLAGDAMAPNETVADLRRRQGCLFVRHQGHRCAAARGPARDMVEGYRGTLDACKQQCCSMGDACAGFEVQGGSAAVSGDDELRHQVEGRCFFRAGALQEPEAWMASPARDCYMHIIGPDEHTADAVTEAEYGHVSNIVE